MPKITKNLKWNRLVKNIPVRVQAGPGAHYEVLTVKEFFGRPEIMGETRFEEKQIILKAGLGNKTTVDTVFHEFLHAISEEHGIGLTEEQVLQMEGTLPYLIKFLKELNG